MIHEGVVMMQYFVNGFDGSPCGVPHSGEIIHILPNTVLYSMVVLYIGDHRGFGVFCPKTSPKNQPHISFPTVW